MRDQRREWGEVEAALINASVQEWILLAERTEGHAGLGGESYGCQKGATVHRVSLVNVTMNLFGGRNFQARFIAIVGIGTSFHREG